MNHGFVEGVKYVHNFISLYDFIMVYKPLMSHFLSVLFLVTHDVILLIYQKEKLKRFDHIYVQRKS